MSIDVNVTNDLVIVTETTEDIVVNVSNAAGPQGPAGQGVPVGGTAGQVLKKLSNTNYDTFWTLDGVGVPYTGATGDVNLGAFNLTANSIIKSGGTSSQFLKANGSVDSTTYTPSTRNITINGTTQDLSADRTFSVGTVTSLTLATGTTGTDVNVSNGTITTSGTITLNIPDASATARGLITTGTQTIAGVKTFSSSPTVPSLYLSNMTAGSGALYYNTPENRLTLANYNVGGILMFEVNGGTYAMTLNADLTARFNGYTTNGFVKFSSSNGTLVVDTTTYQPLLTNPVTGTGVAGQVAYWNGTSSQTGSNNLFWDAANSRLGVGTTSPEYKLDVVGTGNFTGNISTAGTGQVRFSGPIDGAQSIRYNSSLDGLQIQGYGGLAFLTGGGSGSEKMRLTAAGRLLLGTTTESTFLLDVNGTARVSGQVTGDSFVPTSSTIPTNGMYLPSANTLGFASGTSSRMVITSTGAVGIGTTSPTGLFEVKGDGASYFTRGTKSILLNPNVVGADTNALIEVTSGMALAFGTGGAERMRLDSSGNLGLGVVPSAWGLFKVLQIGTNYGALSFAGIGGTMITNAFFDGGAYRYLNNDFAAAFEYNISSGGGFVWRQAPSGTAGNAISFTQAMTLDASGNLGLGATSPSAKLDIVGLGGIRINEDGAGTKVIHIRSNFAGVDPAINVSTNNALLLQTNNAERLRITAVGNLLVGSTLDGGQRLQVMGDAFIKGSGATFSTVSLQVQNSSGTNLFRVYNSGQVRLGNTGSSPLVFPQADLGTVEDLAGRNLSFYSYTGSQSASSGRYFFGGENMVQTTGANFNIYSRSQFFPTSGTATLVDIYINPQISQSGGANGITRGLYVNPTLTAAADWRSIEWSNNSGWGLYGAGTANNYLAGSLGIGTTSPSVPLHVIGNILVTGNSPVFSGGALEIQGSANAIKTFYINRYGVASGSQHRLRAENGYFEIASVNSEPIVLTGGNLLVGTTADNGSKFQVSGAATFSSSVTATSFIKSGGTSSQYLMADGSVTTGGGGSVDEQQVSLICQVFG